MVAVNQFCAQIYMVGFTMDGHIYIIIHMHTHTLISSAQKQKLFLQIRALHVMCKFNYGLSQHNNVNDSVIKKKNTHETVCKVINLM